MLKHKIKLDNNLTYACLDDFITIKKKWLLTLILGDYKNWTGYS